MIQNLKHTRRQRLKRRPKNRSNNSWVFFLVSAFLLSLSVSLVSAPAKADLSTVPSVDLKRYQGVWHEIALIPNSFQSKCLAETTAEYTLLPDGLLKVINGCDEASGSRSVAEGRARINPKYNEPGKLQVTFVKLITWIWAFGGDYWILDLDPEYRYVVIGHPEHKYGWILSRTRTLPLDTLLILRERLKNAGYDACLFVMDQNAERVFPRGRRLCEL